MKIRAVDCRTRLRGFYFHQRCLCKYATTDKRLGFYLCVCVRFCAVSEEILPCFLSVDTVQQHLGDYLSLWKVTVSMSLGQTSQESAYHTHCTNSISDFQMSQSPAYLLSKCLLSQLCVALLAPFLFLFTSAPLPPLFLYLMREQTHLLHHDASLPPSVLPLCQNWQEINPALIYNTPPSSSLFFSFLHILLPLPAVNCPFWTEQKHQHNIMPYQSRHIVHRYQPAPVSAHCLQLPRSPNHKQDNRNKSWSGYQNNFGTKCTFNYRTC